ncbi:MAG: integrase [Chloroflexi bacterium]|nr:integrase [Chloroflexota bacterium]
MTRPYAAVPRLAHCKAEADQIVERLRARGVEVRYDPLWRGRHNERHLRRILAEYERHYNAHRAHQSRDQRPPLHDPDQPIDLTAMIECRTTVARLIHEYRRAA